MNLFDLHCDTLYKAVTNNLPLDDKSMQVSQILCEDNKRLQCYAIWIPDDYTPEKAKQTFFSAYQRLTSECKRLNIKLIEQNESISDAFKNNKNSALFTIENSTALNGKIGNVEKFAKLGVRIITLTWNASNAVGDGADVSDSKGITDFGKSVVREMEKYGVVVDVSHASDKLFYDVAEIATRPFAATHSNSRFVTNHRRNLTDEQFKIIKERNGIVGINFHRDFLSDNPDSASIYDLLKHINKFLSLGGENVICIGTDFDGCNLPYDITGSESLAEIYEMLLRHNYKESLIRKIFYENALNFFENFDNRRIM
ncbi:membrane dipeptidase [Ruminococcus sp.]|uniref:dipeptidase n=1 Tax=Ruminococcus sp. TaxID=41978 RepID=UPI0025FFE415|nr:membrane dipeptidase [Ruminococcus sp.]MCI6616171.1 dipeptidase [Ruminococcus sp.]